MKSPSPAADSRAAQRTSRADDQRETIAFLSEGKSYGLPGAPVRRIETHWSVIFLVADRAYKLKRPLAFSLLDYSTVEKRERASRAELEVNAGAAADLYLGLRKIARRADGSLVFDGDRPAVDWVVAMRRFDQADLFDRLADARRLDAPMAHELADEIARSHARVEATPGHGGVAAMRAAAARWQQEQAAVADIFKEGRSSAYPRAVGLAISDVEALLERRRQEGKVRRCHGDLRLANICLLDGRTTLFDAIEFSEELSAIDVLYDLAFLLMDLHQHALPDLANLVFNRYLDVTGDSDGLPALPIFLSFRAAMRAQMLAAAALRRPAPAAPPLAAAARSHLALAEALLRRRSPRLIAIGGLGNLAKAELAAALACELGPAPGARILRGHVARHRLMNAAPEMRLPPSAYDDAATDRVYDALCREAATALASGTSAIVEMDFLGAAVRRRIADVARAAAVPFTGLWFGERHDEPAPGASWKKREDASAGPDWYWIDPGAALATARALMRSPEGSPTAGP